MNKWVLPRRESGWDTGIRVAGQLQDLAAPLIRQKLLNDRRKQELEDRESAKNDKYEQFQQEMRLKQAMGELGGIRTTPITQSKNGVPASIGALPVSENDPQDLMAISPGVFMSPSENLSAQSASHQRILDQLANRERMQQGIRNEYTPPSIDANEMMRTPIIQDGKIVGIKVSDVPVQQPISDEDLNNMSLEERADLGQGGTQLPEEGLSKNTNLRDLTQQMELQKIGARQRALATNDRPVTGNERLKIIGDFADLSGIHPQQVIADLESGKTSLEEMKAVAGSMGGARKLPEVKSLIGWNSMERNFNRVEELLNSVESEVGPITGKWNEFLVKYPLMKSDPRVLELYSEINGLAAEQIHDKYGGALTPGEMGRALKWTVSTELPFETIKSRIKAAKSGIQASKDSYKDVLNSMRIRAPGINTPADENKSEKASGLSDNPTALSIRQNFQDGTITEAQARKMIEDIKNK